MSTNFYAIPSLAINAKVYHLGQRAVGWKFLIQANGFAFYDDWPSMQAWLREERPLLFDEYKHALTIDEFVEIVENQQKFKSRSDDLHDHFAYFVKGGYEMFDWDFC